MKPKALEWRSKVVPIVASLDPGSCRRPLGPFVEDSGSKTPEVAWMSRIQNPMYSAYGHLALLSSCYFILLIIILLLLLLVFLLFFFSFFL